MRFRKKPVEIDAEQYFLGKKIDGVIELEKPIQYKDFKFVAQIRTIEDSEDSMHYIRESDWIITGIQGEQYTCKNDIFQQTYEAIEEIIEPHHNS